LLVRTAAIYRSSLMLQERNAPNTLAGSLARSVAVTSLLAVVAAGAIIIAMPRTVSAQGPLIAQNTVPAQKSPSETRGQASPQGPTGPINTKSGGAPAASPQGDTPSGMQSAPQGSGEKVDSRPEEKSNTPQ
jgi:hypothetical protein